MQYIGVVNNEQKNKLLGSAAAMLLPVEWYEPFPVVLPEAYACGTPILAYAGGGVPEGIVEGVTGMLSNTAAEMAGHVAKLHTLSRKACREEAEKKYSDYVIANNYLALYNHQFND